MRQANGCGVLLNVLAAMTACPENVHFDVVWVDFYVDALLNFWHHFSKRERRVTGVVPIKRRFPHQTMHASLGPKVPIHVIA